MGEPVRSLVFVLEPVDTLFFRTGRPFNQDDPGAARAESLFPPNPPTVVGALRAGLASVLGWSGRGPWPSDITAILGDRDKLGGLSFRGPHLMRRRRLTSGGDPTRAVPEEHLFPAPACLFGRDDDSRISSVQRVSPRAFQLETDLGTGTLPAPNDFSAFDGYASLAGRWLTSEGMGKVLAGKTPSPSDVLKASDLWSIEERVGIARDIPSRRVITGALYMASHIRTAPGSRVEGPGDQPSDGWTINLAMALHNIPEKLWKALVDIGPDLGTVALGGEHRSAWLRWHEATKEAGNDGKATKHLVAIAQTPVVVDDAAVLRAGAPFGQDGLTIRAVSAGKATSIGGWDSVARHPLPQRPVLPPGTTWHVENRRELTLGDLPRALGGRRDWGFGEVLWCADVG